MWIDRGIPNTDFGIWMRRIVAGIMAAFGFGFAFFIFISSMISTTAELYVEAAVIATRYSRKKKHDRFESPFYF